MSGLLAWDTSARHGAYFAVADLDDVAGEPGWAGWDALVADPRPRVELTRRRLLDGPAAWREPHGGAATATRVAASFDVTAFAARVVSPVLASAVLHATVPVLRADRVRWQDRVPGPVGLAWQVTDTVGASTAALHEHVVEPLLLPLVHAVGAACRVSARVLVGDLASALVGAATVLDALSPGERPHRAARVVAELLATGALQGTAATPPPDFRRASCCLRYRLPGATLCGDCVLTARPPRRRPGSG